MNKPTIVAMAAAAFAVLFSTTASSVNLQSAHAQYEAGTDTGQVTEAQLAECQQLGIDRNQCTSVAILAKKRVTAAGEQGAYGSGTQMLGGAGSTVVFIGVLGAIFGAVAAAFFFKGRGSKPTS